MISSLYHLVIYQPFLNLLVLVYHYLSFSDIGVAIILLTIIIRVALFPLFAKSQKHQMVAQKLQPHMKKIREEHASDPQKQTEAMLALYKEHNFNPFAGFLLLFIQIPVMIALYHVFTSIFTTGALQGLYSFVPVPDQLPDMFLGLISLKEPSIVIVVITAVLQYVQGFLMQRYLKASGNDQAAAANSIMMFLGPVLTLTIFARLPAAVTLYWLVSSIINLVQQEILQRSK